MNIHGSIIIPHVTDLFITCIPRLFTTPQLNWIPHAKLSGRSYNNLIQNSWILETHDMNHVNRYHLIVMLDMKCLPQLDKWSKESADICSEVIWSVVSWIIQITTFQNICNYLSLPLIPASQWRICRHIISEAVSKAKTLRNKNLTLSFSLLRVRT